MRFTKRKAACVAGFFICVAGAEISSLWAQATAKTAWTAAIDMPAGVIATQPVIKPKAPPFTPTLPSPEAIANDPFYANTGMALNSSISIPTVTLPGLPSKYALLTDAAGTNYELWNLKTAAKEKANSPRYGLLDNMVLSPDGKYFTGARPGLGDAAGLDVWVFATDKLLVHIPRGAATSAIPLEFCAPDRLAAYWEHKDKWSLKFHTLPAGTATVEYPLKAALNTASLAFSAGGKYLAFVTDKNLSLVQTDTAKLLGTVAFTPITTGIQRIPPTVAFSPTGKELALVQVEAPAGKDKKLRVTIISVATGQILEDKQTTSKLASLGTANSRTGLKLSWNPDGTRLLLGSAVIDRATLTADFEYPKPEATTTPLTSRWVDTVTVLQFSRQGTALSLQDLQLANAPVAVASTGTASTGPAGTAGTRPTTGPDALALTLDSKDAPLLDLEKALKSPWKITPTEQPKAKPLVASFAVKPMTNLPRGTFEHPIKLLFTDRATNMVLVEHASMANNERNRTWIERYDLATGNASAPLNLDGTYSALDVSSNGNILAFRCGQEKNLVQLHNLDKTVYRLGKTFLPFGAAPPNANRLSREEHPNVVQWAALVDDAHMLVQSVGNQLLMVELSTSAVSWKSEMGKSRNGQTVPALSPDRKLCAIGTPGGVRIIEALTGAPLNTLPTSSETANASCAAFSPAGDRLAAVITVGGQNFLDVYDLTNGQTLARIPLSLVVPRSLVFLSPNYLLTSNGDVYSVERQALVWNYAQVAMNYGSTMPHEKFIYPAYRSNYDQPINIVSAALPHDAVIKSTAKLKEDDLFLWHPGVSVKLEINVVGDDNYRKAQVEQWTTRLKDQGVTVDDQSPNTLRANSFFMSGPPDQYRVGSETVSISRQVVGFDITLLVGGKEIWKRVNNTPPQSSGGSSIIFLQVRQGESAQQAADRQRPQPKEASSIILPPQFIENPRQIEKSRLGLRGPEAMPADPIRGRGP